LSTATQVSSPALSCVTKSLKSTELRQSILPDLYSINSLLKSPKLKKLINGIRNKKLHKDQIISALMVVFRDTRSVDLFNALFKLTYKNFYGIAYSKLRRFGLLMDPQDILQEVYISIYRYPGAFREEHANSFKNWSQTIIRNAVFKLTKKFSLNSSVCEIDSNYADFTKRVSPLEKMVDKERRQKWADLYCLSLSMYLHIYKSLLNPREKEAIDRVEIRGECYKDAAKAMGIKLANFKMIVCRGRKKIFFKTYEFSNP